MTHSLINLSLSKLSYANLAAFSQTIASGFTSQVTDYPTPNPAMSALTADINVLNTAVTKWGVKGNRGSHADHVALKDAANTVRNDLRMLADYAQNKKPDDTTSWIAVGFKIKRAKSKPVALEMVQNLRNFISRDIPAPGIKLKWKKPLGTDSTDVKGYVVQRNNVPTYPVSVDGSRGLANVIGLVPNTSFIDSVPFVGANYYWVTPFNTVGYGVTSDPLMVISTVIKS